jgi:GMP synthase (glutamine-hydrolysing)
VNATIDRILVLDFGGQTTQLIARRVREQKVYCEIWPFSTEIGRIKAFAPKAIILSGGPSSVNDESAPTVDPALFDLGVPVLGICYGVMLMQKLLGGKVEGASGREFGRADMVLDGQQGTGDLFAGLGPGPLQVWMSHGDRIVKPAPGFLTVGHSGDSPYAALADPGRKLFGVLFHPEVVHTPPGAQILANFVRRIAGATGSWSMDRFLADTQQEIRQRVGTAKVLCALSGGVDSAVAAVLVHRAIGEQLTCVFVDTGLLRQGEAAQVEKAFRPEFGDKLVCVDASARFLAKLAGVLDPERKRKIIGAEFIEVFEEEAKKLGGADFLVQGTLYPDVIESVSVRGPSAAIKSHHNVGGLPERLNFRLLEPLRELFKDEVRMLGAELGLPKAVLQRQPFPGPGLAVRILGEVTAERLRLVAAADAIVREEVEKTPPERPLWQYFAVLLPVQSVGVMGDGRTYELVSAIRAVESADGMTADWARLPHDLLGRISSRVINEVRGINRVVYDISSKPPSTIEWE